MAAATAVLLAATLVLGFYAYDDAYWATLLAIAPFLPMLAAVAVCLAYLAPDSTRAHQEALYLGTAAAVGLWVASGTAFRWMAEASTAQSRSYGELVPRVRRLHELLGPSGPGAGPGGALPFGLNPGNLHAIGRLHEAQCNLDTVIAGLSRPGLPFALGTGYVNLWRALHRAEEALIEVDEDSAVEVARYDHDRLEGSTIPNSSDLQKQIQAALLKLDPQAAQAVFGVASTATSPVSKETALALLSGVRCEINEYRDDQWEGLIRERNHVLRTVLASALGTFLLVGLGVARNVSTAAVVAASAYFLVGAVVGLFSRMRTEAQAESAPMVDDYGLFEARLLAAAQISGLAGVAGVFLAALVPGFLATPDLTSTATGTFSAILDLGRDGRGLVVAAVFGLSPELLITGMTKSTDVLKQRLQTSGTAGSH
jgi:hypothetical protein